MTGAPEREGPVAFLGDSLTAQGDWARLFPDLDSRNFGISGDTSDGVLARLEAVEACAPSRVALLIGTNDLGLGRAPGDIAQRVAQIVTRLSAIVGADNLLLQGLTPRDAIFVAPILELNARLERISEQENVEFLDLYEPFLTGDRLDPAVTADGLHLTGEGYARWRGLLAPWLDRPRGAA